MQCNGGADNCNTGLSMRTTQYQPNTTMGIKQPCEGIFDKLLWNRVDTMLLLDAMSGKADKTGIVESMFYQMGAIDSS